MKTGAPKKFTEDDIWFIRGLREDGVIDSYIAKYVYGITVNNFRSRLKSWESFFSKKKETIKKSFFTKEDFEFIAILQSEGVTDENISNYVYGISKDAFRFRMKNRVYNTSIKG